MIGIYLSGTGNTKHCTEKLLRLLDETAQIIPIEDETAADLAAQHQMIILAYPTQFSNAPIMVRDFIKNNSGLWKGKKVLCVATMGLFSGDGAGCTARLLKKYGAKVVEWPNQQSFSSNESYFFLQNEPNYQQLMDAFFLLIDLLTDKK